MEIQQRHVLHGLAKVTLRALEDKVVYEWKSLFQETVTEIPYADINPNPVRGKAGDKAWYNLGWFWMGVLIVLTLFDKNRTVLVYGFLPVLGLIFLSFGMLLVKREYVSFLHKGSGLYAFGVAHPNHKGNKEFVNYVMKKIAEAGQNIAATD